MKTFIIILLIAFIVWVIWSYFSSNVEQLKYSVLDKKDKYEIRKYEKYIEASVLVNDTGMYALNKGFTVLANYIFGDNVGKEKVSMTAPVLTEEKEGKTKVVFSMPSKYSLEDLPKTNDERISFKVVDEKKLAAYRFTWYYTTERIEKKKKEFLEILKNDNVEIVGEPIFAGYNGPGTLPFMMRNEILIEIK